MRFLMLNWRDPRNPLAGGAERVTLAYLQGLRERGHEIAWFANTFAGAAPAETIDGIHILRGGVKGTAVLAARRWFRTQPPFDLVIDQHHGIPWYAPWWSGTRCVAYVHEILGPIWDAFYRWPKSQIGKSQERWTHWLYRRVPFWTASQSTRDGLRQHGVRDVTLIPYGVDTVALPHLDPKPLHQPLRLIVVSRLAPNKRIDHAIRTCHQLRQQRVDAQLTIVGSGADAPRLHELIAGLGLGSRVQFAGQLSEAEKDRHLREAHFLLHTSLREGWGLNIIEANAMGTPAAGYPVAGLVESIRHNHTGLLADTESPEALARCLLSLLTAPDRYDTLRRDAWDLAKTFHWSKVLPQASAWLEQQATRPHR